MAHIDYYFSLQSSFTYLAGDRFDQVAKKHGVDVTYKPFDILTLYDRIGSRRPADRSDPVKTYRLQELKRQSKALGMPMNFQPAYWPVNTAPASYAVIAAQEAGGGDLDGLVRRFLTAVWAEDRNIADDAVITECLSASGYDPMLSMTGMLKGAETYAANLEQAISAGVFGSPFYIITDTDERFWGQDRIAMLDDYLGTPS